jgi:NAD(P)-dependent dehydrogenase (short-subunit alcohol dehydrogenase family)
MSDSKIAIVTGGSRGICRNTVLCLAKRGVRSIFTYKSNRAQAGRVVALAADAGLARFAMPNRIGYGPIKAAVESLTRYMAVELGPRRIAAKVVAPGPIATDFCGGIVRDNPQVNKAIADHTALGRAGVPEDVGPVIAALLSDDFGWINAQRAEVAGGIHI